MAGSGASAGNAANTRGTRRRSAASSPTSRSGGDGAATAMTESRGREERKGANSTATTQGGCKTSLPKPSSEKIQHSASTAARAAATREDRADNQRSRGGAIATAAAIASSGKSTYA